MGEAIVILPVELTVRAIREDDLLGLGWAGSPLHISQMAEQMRLNTPRTKEFLAVFLRTGISIAKGEITYTDEAGKIGSLGVREEWQSLGVGTFLIDKIERRIQGRGLRYSALDVEEDNPRAQKLYERLGYVAYDRQPESWDQQDGDGHVYRYETMCTLMRKELSA
jgi:ribosomal protein S18 acetylase RimI-like enzyme